MERREKRKMAALERGKKLFKEHIEDTGGVYSIKQVTKLLDITKEDLMTMIDKGEVIKIIIDKQIKLPAFQFHEGKVVEGLPEIAKLLGDFSSTTKISFLTCSRFFKDSDDLNVIDTLKKYGPNSPQMDTLERHALLFGSHVPF